METLVANLEPRARRVVEDGREYLVADASLINPGILPGSKGALYYSAEHTAAATEAWDRIPITMGHPVDGAGRHLSASSPGILDNVGIGEVRNPRFDTKLRGQVWIDVKKADAKDPRITQRIRNNQPVPLSTGLFTENILVAAALDPRTKQEYTLEARNHVPDHLALLVDTRGACHLEHGCGVLVNEGGEVEKSCPDCGRIIVNAEGSYFGRCKRDKSGRCLPSESGGMSELGWAGFLAGMSASAALKIPGLGLAGWIGGDALSKALERPAEKLEDLSYRELDQEIGLLRESEEKLEARIAEAGDTDEEKPWWKRLVGPKGGAKRVRDSLTKIKSEVIAQREMMEEERDRREKRSATANAEVGCKCGGECDDCAKKRKPEEEPMDEPATNAETPQSIVGRFLNWLTSNAFCATGEGGGIDNSCSSKGGAEYEGPHQASKAAGDASWKSQRASLALDKASRSEAVKLAVQAYQGSWLAQGAARRGEHENAENNHRNAADFHDKAAFQHEGESHKGHAVAKKAHEGAAALHREAAGLHHDAGLDTGQINNALPNQPRSKVTGYYKQPNAGTGKGEAHTAAQQGNLTVTADDEALGCDARKQKVEMGENPPSWCADEGKWERAKTAAGPDEDSDSHWAKVTAIYKRMGGKVRGKTENTDDTRGDGGATMEEGVATPLSSAPLLLVNFELGYDAAFPSDDLRLEALAGMVGNEDEEEVFQSDEQRNAFFGHLRAAGITPRRERGKGKEEKGKGSAPSSEVHPVAQKHLEAIMSRPHPPVNAGQAYEQGADEYQNRAELRQTFKSHREAGQAIAKAFEARTDPKKADTKPESKPTSQASKVGPKSTEAEIHKWFKEIKASGTAAQAKEFLDKVDGWKGTSYVQAIAHDHDVPIKKDPFFGKSKELASPEELRDRIIAKAFGKGTGTRNQDPSATAAIASLSANSEEDHLNASALHHDTADICLEVGDYQRAEDHSKLSTEHAAYAGILAANAFCATGEGGGVDPSCSPGGSKAASKGTTPRTRKSSPPVHIEAPAEKVARITAALGEAKLRVAALAAELKAAKVDMAAVKKTVKKEVSARAEKAAAKVQSVVKQLNDLSEKWLQQAMKDESRTTETDKWGNSMPTFTGPSSEDMVAEVDRLAGTVSVHALARALGILAKAKNKEDAMTKIRAKILGRVGAFRRVNA